MAPAVEPKSHAPALTAEARAEAKARQDLAQGRADLEEAKRREAQLALEEATRRAEQKATRTAWGPRS